MTQPENIKISVNVMEFFEKLISLSRYFFPFQVIPSLLAKILS